MKAVRRLPYNQVLATSPEIRECWRILRRNGISRETAATAFGISDTTARKLDNATRCGSCPSFARSDETSTSFITDTDSELDAHAPDCRYATWRRRLIAERRLRVRVGDQLTTLTLSELKRARMSDARADALAEEFPPLGRDDVQQVWRDQRKSIIEWLETEPDTYFDFHPHAPRFDAPPPPPVRLAAEGIRN